MTIKFGPGGLGSVKEAVGNLKKYHELGLRACEIEFTYGIYIKGEDTGEIKKAAEKNDIDLSIHAQYWINLNSKEKQKIEDSKKRILKCCEIGEMLGAKVVVFHAGFYGKDDRELVYQNIKKAVLEMMKEIKRKKWKIKIAAETMGKVNVFGSADEILRLVEETGCELCVDFAHLVARENGQTSYEKIYKRFQDCKKLHCHFSGIEFGEKGEKKHILTPEYEWKKLLTAVNDKKDITIINESPDTVGDSVKGLEIYNNL
ncbi:MAG: TIM barrel protein [Nanoarchaeota archaeon]|nr:TIM barrel protein [Nanoarchaeota archaeon]